jgi:hypothetical protein
MDNQQKAKAIREFAVSKEYKELIAAVSAEEKELALKIDAYQTEKAKNGQDLNGVLFSNQDNFVWTREFVKRVCDSLGDSEGAGYFREHLEDKLRKIDTNVRFSIGIDLPVYTHGDRLRIEASIRHAFANGYSIEREEGKDVDFGQELQGFYQSLTEQKTVESDLEDAYGKDALVSKELDV